MVVKLRTYGYAWNKEMKEWARWNACDGFPFPFLGSLLAMVVMHSIWLSFRLVRIARI